MPAKHAALATIDEFRPNVSVGPCSMGCVGEMEDQSVLNVDAEKSVQEVILAMLEEDIASPLAVKEAVLEALAAIGSEDVGAGDNAPTFLRKISVMGFRGIGNQAQIELHPMPGLTVVSGRNGSGKSSFAEALELALTGTSYRWRNKGAMWQDSWRNLHKPHPCAIRIGFTAEGKAPFTVGYDWGAEAQLVDRTTWTQTSGQDSADGTDALGWGRALELCRPVLSYDELGRLFDGGPSALYDALAKLLGLEVVAEAETWLGAELKSAKVARTAADDEKKQLLVTLASSDDERAVRAAGLLKKRPVPLSEVLTLATGSGVEGQQTVATLRRLAALRAPSVDEIDDACVRLRTTATHFTEVTNILAASTRSRVELLQAALHLQEHDGTIDCPVCGQGQLNDDWAALTRQSIDDSQHTLAEYQGAVAELDRARTAAVGLLGRPEPVHAVEGITLSGLDAYNDAVARCAARPDGDVELAGHAESSLLAVAAAADALRAEAARDLAAREDTWAPIAAKLGGWAGLEAKAREVDGTVKTLTAAKKWMSDRAGPFRNQRLETIAAQARKIWEQLRQESNVELGEITLQGTANRRRAVVRGAVDGEPTEALPVMSQGELHAVALALFLPRATSISSPFRFVVLDDPIQAMDPAKIDGFVRVLAEIAQTHQVVVFSHDDRLASTIRETGTHARLVEVVRQAGSKVTAHDSLSPAQRHVDDIFALFLDKQLPDEIRDRVMPGLFRLAVESAAKQAYFTKQSQAGRSRAEFEKDWAAAKKVKARLALAIHGDAAADLTKWLSAKPERRTSFRLANAVHGDSGPIEKSDARALERTVHTLLALR